jgi:hypothetical protein
MRKLILLVALVGFGCNKDSGLLPAENAQPKANIPDAGELPAGHPAVANSGATLPGGHPPVIEGGAAPNGGGEVTGVIDIDPALAPKVKAGDTIFLMARNEAGSMVAVARLSAPAKFPVPFVLSAANAMFAGNAMTGSVRLSARVDKDGDAGSKNPGDIIGEHPDLVAVPSKNIKLLLTKTL